MTNLETAIKYGVPTLKTCVLLDGTKFENSIFVWYCDENNDWEVRLRESVKSRTNETYTQSAPTMHEIAPRVQIQIGRKEIVTMHYESDDNKMKLAIDYVDLDKGIDYKDTTPNVENVTAHHYAEAYALMYIKLREAGLLEKEVSNDN